MKKAQVPVKGSASAAELYKQLLAAGGTEVDPSKAKPGDIFFSDPRHLGRISHTGVYAAGGYLHNPGTKSGFASTFSKGAPPALMKVVRFNDGSVLTPAEVAAYQEALKKRPAGTTVAGGAATVTQTPTTPEKSPVSGTALERIGEELRKTLTDPSKGYQQSLNGYVNQFTEAAKALDKYGKDVVDVGQQANNIVKKYDPQTSPVTGVTAQGLGIPAGALPVWVMNQIDPSSIKFAQEPSNATDAGYAKAVGNTVGPQKKLTNAQTAAFFLSTFTSGASAASGGIGTILLNSAMAGLTGGPLGWAAAGTSLLGGLVGKKKKDAEAEEAARRARQARQRPRFPDSEDTLAASRRFIQGALEGGRQGLPIDFGQRNRGTTLTTNATVQFAEIRIVTENPRRAGREFMRGLSEGPATQLAAELMNER